jgi:hypothetical protein
VRAHRVAASTSPRSPEADPISGGEGRGRRAWRWDSTALNLSTEPRRHASLLFQAKGDGAEHHALFTGGVEPVAGTQASPTPTERPVHGGASSISSHGGPWRPAWKPHALREEGSRYPLAPLFTTPSPILTAHNLATKLHPPRSAATRRWCRRMAERRRREKGCARRWSSEGGRRWRRSRKRQDPSRLALETGEGLGCVRREGSHNHTSNSDKERASRRLHRHQCALDRQVFSMWQDLARRRRW